MTWLGRAWWSIVLLVMLGALAGLSAGVLIKPRYTASSVMVVDPSNLQVIADDLFAQSQQSDAQVLDVESKLRVLTSGNVMRRVVEMLGLEDDPEFTEPEFPSLFGSERASEDGATAALRSLSERVVANREERSYVVNASAWAHSPDKAATLANTIVAAFRTELAQGEADSATQAGQALNDRLGELKDQVARAEDAVESFKRANGLQATGTELLSTQSVNQINTQVLNAQQAQIAARLRYDQLTSGAADSLANAAAQQSPTISALRTQYSTLRQQLDSLAMTLGPRHPRLVAAQSEMKALQGEIDRETARMVQAAKSDLEQATGVLDALRKQATQIESVAFTDGEAQVQLRELERDAASKAAIYESFLTRAKEITERRTLDTTNVRVISTAVPPLSRTYPPRTVVLVAGGALGGLALGGALAVALGLLGRVAGTRRT